jgi:phosphatidylinositol-3-phosphatase
MRGDIPSPDDILSASEMPRFNKIVVVIGENTNASAVIGHTDAPYINTLAQQGAGFIESYAIEHPSQPNYLDLFSGNNQGITGSNVLPDSHFVTPNLGRELLNAGKTFSSYSEDLPYTGFDGEYSGLYVRRHNPSANWMGTGTNQFPDSLNKPFTDFPTDFSTLPNVAFVIPNLCSDGHDACAPLYNRTTQFDQWIQTNLDAYRQWCKANNSLLIVTYDEDDFTSTNKIATVFYGAHVKTGTYNKVINHFNVLRTVEDLMGLATHAGQAATATPIDYCWTLRQ